MFNFYYYDDDGYQSETMWKFLMALGIIVFVIGLMILLVPQILIVIVASILFSIGGIIISNAWKLRKMTHRGQRIKIRWLD